MSDRPLTVEDILARKRGEPGPNDAGTMLKPDAHGRLHGISYNAGQAQEATAVLDAAIVKADAEPPRSPDEPEMIPHMDPDRTPIPFTNPQVGKKRK